MRKGNTQIVSNIYNLSTNLIYMYNIYIFKLNKLQNNKSASYTITMAAYT
jgi:hypothetical protein